MAWRNRISIKGRAQGFQKMTPNGEEYYDMPLLARSSSLSPKNDSSPKSAFSAFCKSPNSSESDQMNTNIAAVSDDIEALAFPDHKRAETERTSRTSTSRSSSPFSSIEEDNAFVAQFDPDIMKIVDENDDSAVATIYDDNTSNDGSLYHDYDVDAKSLRPPSIAEEKEKDDKDSTSKTATSSTDKESDEHRRSEGGSNNRLSSSTPEESIDSDEDPDAAAWKADEIDAFVDAIGFGQPTMEISGVDLLTDRDSSVNELQEVNHLMTFNALVLIQKQKDWIEGSIDATSGANKSTSKLIAMELENLERKIRLMMDTKSWPSHQEREKQKSNPLTPSKAFFKSMALIDKSIEQFHKGYLKFMSKTSQENHELKERVEKLVEVNAALQEQAERSLKKTETIRRLQKQREELTQTVDSTEHIMSELLINAGHDSSPNKKESSKIQSVKMYIQKLETERNALQTEIQSLKTSSQDVTEPKSDLKTIEIGEASSTDIANEGDQNKESLDNSSPSTPSDIDANVTGILDGDLDSKWHTLEQNELEMCSKDDKIKSLSETVAGQESSLASVRAECKLMRMQLLQLETTRNEYKAQCESKNEALFVSQDRISSLEEELLMARADAATYEEDYEAMRQSFATQKVATKQEISCSQDYVKAQVEQVRDEFREQLEKSEAKVNEVKEDRDRLVRDLKTSVEDVEAERDNLETILARNSITPISTLHSDAYIEEEKKESDEDMCAGEVDFDQMRNRFIEKASTQAFAIAQLTEENEMKDEQLKSLQEMVEMLLGKRNGDGELREGAWGKRISRLRAVSQQSASNIINRSRHGSQHGSVHGECTN